MRMNKKKIFLLRHGETEWNEKGVFRGRSDIGLNDNGKRQASALGAALKDTGIERIYSSPLKRAYETAEIVGRSIGAPFEKDEGFQNIDLGVWQGMVKEEVKSKYPKMWEQWLYCPNKLKIPEGESVWAVQRRSVRRMLELLNDGPDIFAVVSHRTVLKVILGGLMGLKGNYFWKFRMDNCSINVLEHEDKRGFMLTKLNATSHLGTFVIENE